MAQASWIERRLDPNERYGLRVTLYAIATLLVVIPFSYFLLQVLSEGPFTRLDTSVAQDVHRVVVDNAFLKGLSFFLSFLGIPPWFYVLIGGSAIFFWRKGHRHVAAYLVTTSLVGGVISSAIKILVDRPRPEMDEPITEAFGKSFPSGHAMTSTIGYGVLLLAWIPLIEPRRRKPAIVGYFVLVALICASRLALGVHYLSDVLGGFFLGLAWLAIGTAAFSVWRREEHKEPVHVMEGVEPEVVDIEDDRKSEKV